MECQLAKVAQNMRRNAAHRICAQALFVVCTDTYRFFTRMNRDSRGVSLVGTEKRKNLRLPAGERCVYVCFLEIWAVCFRRIWR